MSSRFLFTCWPFTGHVNGQLAIAAALRDRGHEVAFFSGESARATIGGAGFPLFPFEHVDEQRVDGLIRVLEGGDPRARPNPALLRRTLRDWLVETIPDQMADLEPLIDDWRPDVIVSDLSMWAPFVLLWDKTRIPVALSSTFMGPLIPGPDAPPWGLGLPSPRSTPVRLAYRAVNAVVEAAGVGLRRRLDELRRQHGLGPLGAPVNTYTAQLPLYLVGNIPELDYDRHDLPDSVQYVGGCLWFPPANPDATALLDGLSTERPWIHVSEGTLHTGEPFLLHAAARGLAPMPVEAVLTAGGRDPDSLGLGPLPPNIHLARWVNHADLLPRCQAVVTAGGAGTIISSLQAGVPLVVVPTTWDKPDNARRVVEAGVGVRLAAKRCTPDTLRAAVQTVLRDPSYARNARRIAAVLAESPGPARAAELLDALAVPRARPGYSVSNREELA